MKIALYLKPELEESDIATYLISKISEHGLDIDEDYPDIVMFVGGDGTLLRAAQAYLDDLDEIKFVGVNKGSLGFYAGYSIDEVDKLLDDLESGFYSSRKHPLIEAVVDNQKLYAVNEIRIENPFHTLIADVYINEELFETFRGNGLVISSSIGSSAYNKSLGGAVVVPEVDTLQLTEIAPINNRVYSSLNASLVMPSDYRIEFSCAEADVVVGYDHQTLSTRIKNIAISSSNKTIEIIYPANHSFIKQYGEAFLNE